MKNITILSLSIVILLSFFGCQSPNGGKTGTTDSTFTLSGSINGLDSGWIFLIRRQANPSVTDSVPIHNGRFVFTGKAPSPELCLLGIIKNGEWQFRQSIFLQNGTLTFTGKKDSLQETASTTGAPVQEELNGYEASRKPIDSISRILEVAYKAAKDAGDKKQEDSIIARYRELDKRERAFAKDYAFAHPASYVAAYKIYSNYSFDAEPNGLDSIYSRFTPEMQQSYFGKKIKDVLESAQRTAKGRPAPDFSLPDANGKAIPLSSLKGQYVLLDFWASWCGPCRQENPNVVAAYHRFHPKGFTILSVSLDDNKNDWQQAIQKDHLEWPNHVSDLKGWKNSAAQLYGVNGIPMNYLLDKDGKIIDKDLRGEALEKKLEEVVK
jgi:peroxiredoxin